MKIYKILFRLLQVSLGCGLTKLMYELNIVYRKKVEKIYERNMGVVCGRFIIWVILS